jgi:thioesterase domain-containing protein
MAHSFGAMLALHIAKALEAAGKTGKLLAIDGSPLMMKAIRDQVGPEDASDEDLQDAVLWSLVAMDYSDNPTEVVKALSSASTWEQKVESFVRFSAADKEYKRKYSENLIYGLTNRMLMTKSIDLDSFPVLESTELSAIVASEKLADQLPADLGFGRYSTKQVKSVTLPGNHVTVISSLEPAMYLS